MCSAVIPARNRFTRTPTPEAPQRARGHPITTRVPEPLSSRKQIVSTYGPFQQHLPHRGDRDAMKGQPMEKEWSVRFDACHSGIRQQPLVMLLHHGTRCRRV
jgi:hypothetical protein